MAGEIMHPEKAKLLAELAEDSSDIDREIREQFAIFVRPDRHSVTTSIEAGIDVAMDVTSALLLDVTQFIVSRSHDEIWEHYPRDDSSADAPPNEELKPTSL